MLTSISSELQKVEYAKTLLGISNPVQNKDDGARLKITITNY